jgi:hypothetical protein
MVVGSSGYQCVFNKAGSVCIKSRRQQMAFHQPFMGLKVDTFAREKRLQGKKFLWSISIHEGVGFMAE